MVVKAAGLPRDLDLVPAVDVGTGSGLLAMFAARAGASVTAFETESNFDSLFVGDACTEYSGTSGPAGVAVTPQLAAGEKCQRCWQVLPEVSAHPDHLCARCDVAVAGTGA